MDKIKFGIDGWWGIIAKDFTLANVAKVAYAIARWMTNKFKESSIVLGYDCRFGGEMFMEAIAKILASKGIQVYIPENFVSSPMVSLGVLKLKAQCGVIVSASHTPANYNGIKIKGAHGGPILDKDLKDIEAMISSDYEFDLELLNWNYLVEQGKIQYVNLESIYIRHLHEHFNFESINTSGMSFAFDAMYGSTQRIFPKIMAGVKLFHCEENPSFNKLQPEPVHKNLHEMADYVWKSKSIDCSLAVDSDGSRMALYDSEGNFIDSHNILLLLIHFLVKYKDQTGKVIVSFSCTSMIEKLCAHYGLEVVRVPMGFNHIADYMLREDILVGGEESGGMTVGSYLPDKDGVWMGLLIWNWLIESGMSLQQLVQEFKEITGEFSFERMDLRLNKNVRSKILDKCKKGEFTEFKDNLVVKTENLDGYKFYFDNNEWVLIRASSMMPMIRIYAEAQNPARVREILFAVQHVLRNTL